MDLESLQALEEALHALPDNENIRKKCAFGFYELGHFEKAKEHITHLVKSNPSNEFKLLLAKCYAELENYNTAIVICEELLLSSQNPQLFSLYINLLIRSGQRDSAIEEYQKLKLQFPDWYDQSIDNQLVMKQYADSFSGLEEDNDFMEKPDTSFEDVGGMETIKEEIRLKIIHPLSNQELYKAYGKKIGGGILLYGPPGCGKTYIAKATAGEINSKFMAVGLDDILDMYLGNSEKNLGHKFDVARAHSPCVLFFDEIDALGSKRNDLRQSAGKNTINQFLNELDGINSDNDGLLILGATNSPWHMDSAFLRPGRFDRIIFVPPPDLEARTKIIEIQLEGKPIDKIDYGKVAKATDEFSGADIKLLVDLVIEEKLTVSMKTGKIEQITTKDFVRNAKKVKPSTKQWFNSARNYALYSNSSGLYDDVATYLKL